MTLEKVTIKSERPGMVPTPTVRPPDDDPDSFVALEELEELQDA